jgi:hypothetical protein
MKKATSQYVEASPNRNSKKSIHATPNKRKK